MSFSRVTLTVYSMELCFSSMVFTQMALLSGVCFLAPGTTLNEHSNQDLSWYISTPGWGVEKLQLPSISVLM